METGSNGSEVAKDLVSKWDLLVVPVLEAALIVLVALAGWLTHAPFVFGSLGPTAYELIEMPDRVSARPYSVIVGHMIGLCSGFLGVLLSGAGSTVAVSAAGVPLPRVFAAGVAVALTVFGTRLVKATQPAALSTSLLIALGTMRGPRDAGVILGAVLVMTAVGEPLRAWREQLAAKVAAGARG